MNKWTWTAAQAALVTSVVVGAGAGIASADTHTNGDFSLLGGNQLNAPISAPINIMGTALSGAGFAAAASKGGAFVHNSGAFSGEWHTSGMYSGGGGNQINLPVSAPINVCGNAASIAGVSKAACKGAAIVINTQGHGKWKTSGKNSALGGNQVGAPISAPINACGNAISAGGIAKAFCKGAAIVINGHKHWRDDEDDCGQACDHDHDGRLSLTNRLTRVLFAAPSARRTQPVPPATGASGPALQPLLQGITGPTSPIAGAELPVLPGSGPVSVGSPLDSLTHPATTGAAGSSAASGAVGGLLGTGK